MSAERTLSILKPNAVAKNVIGSIYSRFERAGFTIVGIKMLHLTREQAAGFYAEHDGKPFLNGLLDFMTSGPVVVQVLESDNAVQRYRDLMGATNPANALAGTLRADYADSLTENAVHGSDSTGICLPVKLPIFLVKMKYILALAKSDMAANTGFT